MKVENVFLYNNSEIHCLFAHQTINCLKMPFYCVILKDGYNVCFNDWNSILLKNK